MPFVISMLHFFSISETRNQVDQKNGNKPIKDGTFAMVFYTLILKLL